MRTRRGTHVGGIYRVRERAKVDGKPIERNLLAVVVFLSECLGLTERSAGYGIGEVNREREAPELVEMFPAQVDTVVLEERLVLIAVF